MNDEPSKKALFRYAIRRKLEELYKSWGKEFTVEQFSQEIIDVVIKAMATTLRETTQELPDREKKLNKLRDAFKTWCETTHEDENADEQLVQAFSEFEE